MYQARRYVRIGLQVQSVRQIRVLEEAQKQYLFNIFCFDARIVYGY